jgi:pimeloyl-ACP methyl ester carboxylesterase
MPTTLVEALRLSSRRPQNARSVGSLMHAINGFRRPRPESVLSDHELATTRTPTTFIWGTQDPYLTPEQATPAVGRMPDATLHELQAGHGPWLVHPQRVAELIRLVN